MSRRNQQVALMRETSIHGGIGKINRAANYVSTESGQDQLTAALHNYLGVRCWPEIAPTRIRRASANEKTDPVAC